MQVHLLWSYKIIKLAWLLWFFKLTNNPIKSIPSNSSQSFSYRNVPGLTNYWNLISEPFSWYSYCKSMSMSLLPDNPPSPSHFGYCDNWKELWRAFQALNYHSSGKFVYNDIWQDKKYSLIAVSAVAKDMLRDDGGLQFVFKLLTETSDVEVQEAAMYTLGCAVENNGRAVYKNNYVSGKGAGWLIKGATGNFFFPFSKNWQYFPTKKKKGGETKIAAARLALILATCWTGNRLFFMDSLGWII